MSFSHGASGGDSPHRNWADELSDETTNGAKTPEKQGKSIKEIQHRTPEKEEDTISKNFPEVFEDESAVSSPEREDKTAEESSKESSEEEGACGGQLPQGKEVQLRSQRWRRNTRRFDRRRGDGHRQHHQHRSPWGQRRAPWRPHTPSRQYQQGQTPPWRRQQAQTPPWRRDQQGQMPPWRQHKQGFRTQDQQQAQREKKPSCVINISLWNEDERTRQEQEDESSEKPHQESSKFQGKSHRGQKTLCTPEGKPSPQKAPRKSGREVSFLHSC